MEEKEVEKQVEEEKEIVEEEKEAEEEKEVDVENEFVEEDMKVDIEDIEVVPDLEQTHRHHQVKQEEQSSEKGSDFIFITIF